MELKEKEETSIIEDTNNNLTNIELKNNEKIVKNEEFKPLPNNYNNKNTSSDILTLFAFLSFTFIILLLIAYCTFTIVNTKNDKIIKGIYIKGFDVSNLSKEEALKKISEEIDTAIPEEITLTHDTYETSIPSTNIDINFNIEEAVNIAYDIGRNGNIFENNFNIIKTAIFNVNIEPAFSINENQLSSELKDISAKLPDKMIDSSYYIDGTNLIITKGTTGYIVNIDESIKIIRDKIYNLNINDSIEVSTVEQSPSEINLDNIYNEIHERTCKCLLYTKSIWCIPK